MRAWWAAAVSFGWVTASAVPPIIIHDAGGTEPIAPYMAPYMEPAPEPGVTMPPNPDPPSIDTLDLTRQLPVTTPTLQPGLLLEDATLEVFERLRFLARPFCVVGSDPKSLQWLTTHGDKLREMEATCLAVEVPDTQAWEALVEAARGLPIAPVPGEELAETFGLRVYPVLIARDGFRQ